MPHILVVDDEEAIRSVFQLILTAAGHRVSTARSGEEALRLIDRDVFDLILTDHRMPGMSGARLVERVRAHPQGGDVPILLVSGAADDAELDRLEVQGRLAKPVDSTTLLELVRALSQGLVTAPARGLPRVA